MFKKQDKKLFWLHFFQIVHPSLFSFFTAKVSKGNLPQFRVFHFSLPHSLFIPFCSSLHGNGCCLVVSDLCALTCWFKPIWWLALLSLPFLPSFFSMLHIANHSCPLETPFLFIWIPWHVYFPFNLTGHWGRANIRCSKQHSYYQRNGKVLKLFPPHSGTKQRCLLPSLLLALL